MKTPYSRSADGKAVLRSSIREFLCSEALHTLGIPTTRAGSIIVTDDKAERDPLYNGKVIMEPCAVVLRIAPSFLRFGSFEICNGLSAFGEGGPSIGMENVLIPKLLDYLLEFHYSEIKKKFEKKED